MVYSQLHGINRKFFALLSKFQVTGLIIVTKYWLLADMELNFLENANKVSQESPKDILKNPYLVIFLNIWNDYEVKKQLSGGIL